MPNQIPKAIGDSGGEIGSGWKMIAGDGKEAISSSGGLALFGLIRELHPTAFRLDHNLRRMKGGI